MLPYVGIVASVKLICSFSQIDRSGTLSVDSYNPLGQPLRETRTQRLTGEAVDGGQIGDDLEQSRGGGDVRRASMHRLAHSNTSAIVIDQLPAAFFAAFCVR